GRCRPWSALPALIHAWRGSTGSTCFIHAWRGSTGSMCLIHAWRGSTGSMCFIHAWRGSTELRLWSRATPCVAAAHSTEDELALHHREVAGERAEEGVIAALLHALRGKTHAGGLATTDH